MDLSKAYDCLPHDLLIAKLEEYGSDFNSLCLMYRYLDCRHQRVKIGSLRPRLHCTGATSAPEQKVLRFSLPLHCYELPVTLLAPVT